MKKSFLFLMLIFFSHFNHAQPSNYNELWDKVERLEVKGLPKSALEIVETIEKKALKDKNDAQFVKTMLFKSKFALVIEENAQLKIIDHFKAQIKVSAFPTKNILESILANLYWQYFQQHRWKFYNRTKTSEKVDSEDFRTWDLQTLFDEIHLHYQNSLKNGLMLQLEDLFKYTTILTHENDSKLYRPTLFDFLNHTALEFYKTNETHITKPAYKFEIDNPNFLDNAKIFSQLKIESKDSTSLQLHALNIYKDLIKFHLKDTSAFALADVNINRLKFVNQHATFNDKQNILIEALKTDANILKDHETSGLYNYEIALAYKSQSQKYQPKTNKAYRWKAKEALELCDTTISNFPDSKGAKKCSHLRNQILQESLQITAEKFISIQQDSRLLIRYKNLEQLQFNVFKISRKQLEKLNKTYRKEEQKAFLEKLDVLKQWNSQLPNKLDYQSHTTEILVPKLNNGTYIIYAHNNEETFAFSSIQVTNIALIETEDSDEKIFQAINRLDGTPIQDTQVKLSYYKNNRNNYTTKNYTTDQNGIINITKDNSWYRNVNIEIVSNHETSYFGNYYLNQKRETQKNETTYKSFLFTDRSIYRPGQTLYFKGIITKRISNKTELIANESVFATLHNSNGEKISELNFDTNEFGSFSGEFVLPTNGLNGEYYIEVYSTYFPIKQNYHFSVEEYKRPKFETKFSPITKTFKINDSVTIKGNAIAYAGSNITEAKVVYRVHRKVQYPRWFSSHSYKESQEITHGETTTNSKGEFEIIFKALPDASVDKSNLPIFKYEVTADVTDLNGETRSATTTVNVGYHALLATIEVNQRIDKFKKDQTLTIDSKNLNGEFIAAKGKIKIHKIEAPNYVLRTRPWAAPDYKSIDKETFKSRFPHDAYAEEHISKNWKKGELVYEKSFDTKDSKTLKLGKLKKWQSGKYIITLESKDKFGQLVKDEVQTTLFSHSDKTLADKQLFSISTNKTTYSPDESVELQLASAAEALTVTVHIEKKHQIVQTHVITLNKDRKTINIPVSNEDIGGFSISYSFAAFNSYQSGNLTISVPYPKTDLEIETTTFRDKLQPGTDETWSFKIKGPKGDKVSAELLASMYDASLDQFKGHSWNFNPINNPTYYSYNRNRGHQSFGTQNFKTYHTRIPNSYFPRQDYDQLNWFGFDLNNNRWTYKNYLNELKGKHSAKYESKHDSNIEKGIIKGSISDSEGNPLIGASIIIKGSSNGDVADINGNFIIKANQNDTIVISFLGFLTQQILIKKNNSFKITLEEDNTSLDEVIIVGYGIQKKKAITGALSSVQIVEDKMEVEESMAFMKISNSNPLEDTIVAEEFTSKGYLDDKSDLWTPKNAGKENINFDDIKIRKNLSETAFFFPQLQTDKEGNVSFNFTTPEALTKWKLQLLAHTKTLESATKTLTAVTQKELMVIPNAPRFLREGDNITISSKIANLSKRKLSGTAILQLFDAITGNKIDTKLDNTNYNKTFTVEANGNTQTSWNLTIPDDIQAVQYKILAKAGDYSDGEQNALPVLSNRMLVTETLPMWIKSNQTKTFSLDKLTSNTSTTLKNHKLTLEMTSNPAWYAVQALPYLMEYPYECNEQTFSRYYANVLASYIANSNPRIQEVFKQWRNSGALLSNLEKNHELKSILIQETPWLRDAQNETEQKKRIALLFDLNKMNTELQSAIKKLKANQLNSGAWSWFKGGRENRYITQHIITGFGHLKQLNVIQTDSEKSMISKALKYLDSQFIKEYKDIRKYNKDVDLNQNHLSYTQLHYLYMRSFFPEIKKPNEVDKIITYYQSQIKKYWLSKSLYSKGLMALVSHRNKDIQTTSKILKSLKETSITNEELGMYWKANTNSWYWYQAPIETQALLIETFAEAGHIIQNETKNLETIDNLKIWLLKNKQTNRWKTTKATTEAVYALLLQGSDWLSVTDMVDVIIGGQNIEPSKLEHTKVEAGTGYYKTSWNTTEIKPEMGKVKITKKGNGIAWGSLYWQYFEDLDKITSAETPLKLKKKLFLKTNTDIGEKITEITDNTNLKVGDLVRVRIELKSDRNMEFLHMKDMRASGLEPINVISKYKWQDGLGYYESTKDASTNFFFDYLPKGVYVFEYDLRINNPGHMSNGITSIQSMYAPEFSSHSKGTKILVKN